MSTLEDDAVSVENARRAASEILRQASDERDDTKHQVDVIAGALVSPTVLGLILLGLILFGETDASVKGSAAVTVSLVVLAGALILVPLLAFARSRNDYIKLRDESAARLSELARIVSKIGRDGDS